MPRTINFLDTVIRSLEPGSSRQVYWCNGCPGFGLRVTPSGTKSFVFKYMSSRESRWVTLGKYPRLSVHDALRQYYELYEQVSAYGQDPVQDAKDELERQKRRRSVSEFIETYQETMQLKEKATIAEEMRVFGTDVIPVIGELCIDEVTPEHIDQIQTRIMKRAKDKHNATRGGKVAVRNSLAYTRQLFNLAKKKRLIDSNPVTEVDSFGVAGSRDRVLSFKELWLFWNRIETVGIPPVTAKALKFVLSTMQRSTEVRNMRYSAFKPEENVWQMEVHETKNRKMHRVPMNSYALEILDQVRPFTEASQYVFGATRAMSPPKTARQDLLPFGITAFPQAIRKNRDAIGVENFCPHDLRRTGATWITAVGLPKLYARLMLNHSDGERDVTGEVYVQYSYDFEKRRAAEVWEFVLDQIVTSPDETAVPSLDTLRARVRQAGLI